MIRWIMRKAFSAGRDGQPTPTTRRSTGTGWVHGWRDNTPPSGVRDVGQDTGTGWPRRRRRHGA